MKKNTQRTSHLPFNKKVDVSPIRASSVQSCKATKSPSIVSSPHNFVLKKPERAKRLIVIKGQVRSSLYTLFHPHMYIYKTCHTMLPYSSDSKLLKMYGEYRKIRVR